MGRQRLSGSPALKHRTQHKVVWLPGCWTPQGLNIVAKVITFPCTFSEVLGTFSLIELSVFLTVTKTDPPFNQNRFRLFYNHDTSYHLRKLNTHVPNLPPFFWQTQDQMIVSLCLIWKVHCWSFCLKEQNKVLENSLKMYGVPQNSLKTPWKRYVMIFGNHEHMSS